MPGYMASWRQGTAVPSNTPIHALFDLYFAHSTPSLFNPTTITTAVACGIDKNIVFVYATRIILHNVSGIAVDNLLVGYRRESFLGGQHRNAIPRPTALIVTGQQRCADRGSLICISWWTLTKDPHLQTLAICNLESAVRPCLIATLCSQYKPVW